jgi:hypothetical protein
VVGNLPVQDADVRQKFEESMQARLKKPASRWCDPLRKSCASRPDALQVTNATGFLTKEVKHCFVLLMGLMLICVHEVGVFTALQEITANREKFNRSSRYINQPRIVSHHHFSPAGDCYWCWHRAREQQARERSAAYWEQRKQIWIAASDEQREAARHARTEADMRLKHQRQEWLTLLASFRFLGQSHACVSTATEDRLTEIRENLAATRIQK